MEQGENTRRARPASLVPLSSPRAMLLRLAGGSGHQARQMRHQPRHQRGGPGWFHWGSGNRTGTSGWEGDQAPLRAARLPPPFVHAAQAGQGWVGLGWVGSTSTVLGQKNRFDRVGDVDQPGRLIDGLVIVDYANGGSKEPSKFRPIVGPRLCSCGWRHRLLLRMRM